MPNNGVLVAGGKELRLIDSKRGFKAILAHDPMVDPKEMAALGVESVGFQHLIAAAEIEQMKRECILINTSRGPVIDTAALVLALKEERIAAAGLDVLEQEPPADDDPLVGLPNVGRLSQGPSGGGLEALGGNHHRSVPRAVAGFTCQSKCQTALGPPGVALIV